MIPKILILQKIDNKPNLFAMKIKIFLNCFFILLFSFLFGQQNEKLAPAFLHFKEKQQNKALNVSTPSTYSIAQSYRLNPENGNSELGYDCVIYTNAPEALLTIGIPLQSIHSNFVTAWLSLDQISKVSTLKEVKYVDIPKNIKPTNDISVASSGASLLHAGRLDNTSYKGDGVLVAIIDTGVDWDHPDFRNISDQTKSRILKIWDQTLTPVSGESSPSGYNFGVEYTQTQINNEIDGTPANFVRSKDTDGHGTHVAGIAVGNGAALDSKYAGLAPNADIVIIKAGSGSFNTNNIISALDYLKKLATSLNKPIVVNLSIGSQSGAHDGTDPMDIAINDFTTSASGRVVVVASGNENGENLHKQLTLSANASSSISLQVPTATGTTSKDVFQFTIYANDNSAVNATLTDPNGGSIAISTNSTTTGTSVFGGNCTAYYSNSVDLDSGDRRIQILVTRNTTSANASGTWTFGLTNATTKTLTIDSWLDITGADYTFATTALTGGDSNYLVGSPGSAANAITVGAYIAKIDWTNSTGGALNYTEGFQDDICLFSSIGPRRDNLIKPDLTANGQAAISCTSSDAPAPDANSIVVSGLYRVEQGTSMATPVVSGCVALLLQKTPNATYSQIKSALLTTANKDSFTGTTANAIWGNGKVDVFKAASTFTYCNALERTTYNYEQKYTGGTANASYNTANKRAALRFTNTNAGILGGVYYKTSANLTLTSLSVEVFSNNNGVPGTSLGSLPVPISKINKFSWNYFDLSSLAISLSAATEYFVVFKPGNSDTFGLGKETANSGRSFVSSDGTTWTSVTNLRIRPVVYSNLGSSLPVINSVTAQVGNKLLIKGTGLTNLSQQPTVTVGGATATIVSATATEIVINMPTGKTGGAITVTNVCGTNANPITFNYTAPTIAYNSGIVFFGKGIASSAQPHLVSGDPAESYSISPNTLPAGLSFNTSTGVISGTATTVTAATPYTVTATNLGGSKTTTFTLTVDFDDDGDGIKNADDLCPNTTTGAKVDFNGCEIFILPSNNYSVQATATTCIGQQNGKIGITATNTNYTYNVAITGQTALVLNAANGFSGQAQNLATGTYEVCITIQGKTGYQQCYTIKVVEPTPLSATNKLVTNAKQVTYSLSEANSYTVTLNGKSQTYTSSEITLDLIAGQNTIEIATDLACQGKIVDAVFVNEKSVSFPNPTLDKMQIYVAGNDQDVLLTITNLSGKIIDSKSANISENRVIDLDLTGLASGMYLVHLNGNTQNEVIKVLKK